ncbi:MAG: hypothetical protein ACSHW7_14970 [Patiriisocius sp.]|uniref:hypothetical protein n=1 Tax=Patiriisocius sp. TaxID=2822396 RepID=UPI003EF81F8F
MNPQQTYLNGKSVFIVSSLVIAVTIITVYLTGVNYNRSLTSNLYLSLSIIGFTLFVFMTFGLYKGLGLKDDFPKYKEFESGALLGNASPSSETPSIDIADGIGGIITSILLWIGMTIAIILLSVLLEVIFWFSLFILLTMLYWVFFRALKFVFSKSIITKGDIGISLIYAITFTSLYLGWLFVLVYLKEIFS